MFSLTEEQIAFIENDIKVRGITSSDLSIDLLDHICCLIENKLDGYRNFDSVYQETILLFGEKGLKEIQDETNRLLTFKHYYIMNATMKISGYISSLMILFGAFFKFNHWPGANALLVVGMFFLTVLFLPLLFILKFKSSAESNRSVVLSSIAFVSALLICLGILFKIMHWPNAQMLTIAGGLLLLLGYLPIYFISIYKNETNKMNATATIVLIIAGVGIAVINSFGGIPKQTSDSFWRGVTDNEQLLNYLKTQNNKTYELIERKSNSDSLSTIQLAKVKEDTREIIEYLDKLKAFLISSTENISIEEAKKINIDELRTSGGSAILSDILMSNSASEYSAAELKKRIELYKSKIAGMNADIDLSGISTDDMVVYHETVEWERANFEKLPIPLVVYNLSRIEVGIKLIESTLLNRLQ